MCVCLCVFECLGCECDMTESYVSNSCAQGTDLVCCSGLKIVAAYCRRVAECCRRVAACSSVLHCVKWTDLVHMCAAVCCSVFQCVAVCCSVL